MAAKAKASPTKKVVKAKASASKEYTGTKQLFNAQEPAKDPKRVAAAKKAKATLRAKLLKRSKTSKKGASKKGKGTGKPRGPTAFFVFSAEKRAEVKKSHPSWKVTEIASELGKQWRALSADKKKAYATKAAAQKPKA
eukprot:PhF_6_TR641/c1_g4_i1/m.895